MEGASRPGFFRGVATVVLKLFNIVEVGSTCSSQEDPTLTPRTQPSRAYFGQKDIQQALLLRRMLTDLHLSHPSSSNLLIIPTFRNPSTGLALSSRNAYLLPEEREWATVLYDALQAAEGIWKKQRGEGEGVVRVDEVLEAARGWVRGVESAAREKGVKVELMYVTLNDPDELGVLEGEVGRGRGAVLSGAVMLGRTRLIDNLLFDFELN